MATDALISAEQRRALAVALRWGAVAMAMLFLLAWFGGCSDSVGVQSIPAVVKISPDTLTILTGQSSQLTATAWDANGNELSPPAVAWSSKNTTVATVSSAGLLSGMVLGRDTITATVDGISGTALITVLSPNLAKVTVSPDSTGVASNGILQLTATLDDGNGHRLIDGPVTWATLNPSVATVSRTGLVTAVDSGRDTITAFSGGKTGVAILDVGGPEQPASGILVSDLAPKPTPQVALGSLPSRAPGVAQATSAQDSVTYVAIPPGTVPDGITAQAFNPASASLVTAAMNAGGLDPVPVGAKAGDTVTVVTTTSGGITRTVRVPVARASAPIVIRGQPPKKKTDVPLNSVLAYVFSEPVDPRTISTQSVQLVKEGQLVPGQPVLQPGGLRVDFIPDAPLDPQSAYTLLVTTAVKSLKGQPLSRAEVSTFSTGTFVGGLSFVFVTPSSAAIVVGGAIQLTATPADTVGDPVRAGPVTWSTSNPSVATVSASGLVTAVGQGQATIEATANNVTGRATITVVPPTSLIIDGVWDWTERIVGNAVTCNDTGSYAFTQVGVNFAGQSQQVGSCRTPGDNAHADPVTTGLITGNDISFGVGSGGNTCSYTGHATGTPASSISGPVSCSDGSTGTWSAARQKSIGSVTVTPSTATLFPGNPVQLIATLADGQGNRVFFRQVTWSSDQPSVATVSAAGLVTAVAPGSATITAGAGGKSGTASVVVLTPVASVQVTPLFDTIATGGTVQFTAVPKDAAGNPLTGRAVGWSSFNATVATITSTGVATAVAVGGTSIIASVENASGSATLTVTGTPVDIAGEWSFTQEFDSTDMDGNPVFVCADSGSLVLSQNGLAVSGTSSQVGNCPNESTRTVTNGTLSGRVISFSAGGCRYVVTVSVDLRTFSGSSFPYLCPGGNGWIGYAGIQAARVGPPTSLSVSPASDTLVSGGSVQLGATLRDAAGDPMYGHPVAWSSDNPGVATVSGSGLVTGVGAGSATITASAASVSGTATVTVMTVSFASLSTGSGSTCGLTAAGAAFCWGYNGGGLLGDGDYVNRSVPTAVLGGMTFGSVVVGVLHACGLTSGGTAYCWGSNGNGQLGDGSGADHLTPAPVAGGLTFTSLTAGAYHTCGLATGGAPYCWGGNFSGQLGDGSAVNHAVPTLVAGGLTYVSVTAGQLHACALTAGGEAYCWGANSSGQLGNGDPSGTSATTPVRVAGGIPFAALAAGGDHTCALTQSGAAYCWGNNFSGQLGDGSTTNHLTPVPVNGGLIFATIAPGLGHTCGLTTGGGASCWGLNSGGEIGDGSTSGSLVPVSVAGGFTFTAVRAGDAHSCAIATSGVAYCWGYNSYGALGDGTTTNRSVPVKVAGQP